MSGLIEFLKEMCEGLGAIQFKRMFGGRALVSPDGMFGLVAGDVLYLKADADNAATYEAEGLEPFSYATKDGSRTLPVNMMTSLPCHHFMWSSLDLHAGLAQGFEQARVFAAAAVTEAEIGTDDLAVAPEHVEGG